MPTSERPVVLQIATDPALLRVARVAAASLAATLPFTLQDIEDLRVAVDEMAALAMDGCGPDMVLELSMRIGDGSLEVSGRVVGAGPLPEVHPVAADLLALVVGDYDLATDGSDRTFRFAKRAQVPA